MLLKRLFLPSKASFLSKHKKITINDLKTFSKESKIDEELLFLSPRVQELLKKITGFDIDKILKARPIKDVEPPKYKLLTTQQLEELQEEAREKAKKLLQMPPYKRAWKAEMDSSDILAKDSEIAHYDKNDSSFAFVDISPGIKCKDRSIVVREPDGTLRNSVGEERDNLLNVYYPREGRMFYMPTMFQEESIVKLLARQSYEYILSRACVQFEPDDPRFLSITGRTYEHILSNGQFDQLRSTRFFGPMAYYFVLNKKIDLLLCDMLDKLLVEDAIDLVRLYHLAHPSSSSATKTTPDTPAVDILKIYMELDGKEKMALKMSLEGYERKLNISDKKIAENF